MVEEVSYVTSISRESHIKKKRRYKGKKLKIKKKENHRYLGVIIWLLHLYPYY